MPRKVWSGLWIEDQRADITILRRKRPAGWVIVALVLCALFALLLAFFSQ